MVGFLGLLGQGSAQAEEIATVHMTADGPDRPLPIGSNFYLAGTAQAGTKRVRPVFVRYSYPIWGIPNSIPPRNCSEVKAALSTLKESDELGSLSFYSEQTGRVDIDAVWRRKESPKEPHATAYFDQLNRRHEAFLSGVWTRADADLGKAVDYKILIPSSSFFRPGARYCLLLYQQGDLVRGVGDIQREISIHVQNWTACNQSADCQLREERRLQARLDKILEDYGGSRRKPETLQLIRSLIGSVASLPRSDDVRRLRLMLQNWSEIIKTPTLGEFMNVQTHPLAGAIAGLIAAKGKELMPVVTPGVGTEFYTPDGKLAARHLMVTSQHENILVTDSPASKDPAQHRLIELTPDKLLLPESELTLLDLLEFVSGRIKVADRYVRIADLGPQLLDPALSSAATPALPNPIEVARVAGVRAKAEKLYQFIRRALRARAEHLTDLQTPSQSQITILAELGRWLVGCDEQLKPQCKPVGELFRILQPCEELRQLRSSDGKNPLGWLRCAPSKKAAGPSLSSAQDDAKKQQRSLAWPGFISLGQDPLAVLATTLGNYENAAKSWREDLPHLAEQLTFEIATIASPLVETKLSVKQDTWIFSYVTLITGFGYITKAVDPFWLNYVGIQLYMWANPVDEPMWVNGKSDWRRLVFLEFAVATKNGNFGPDNRFSGPNSPDVPPLFLGMGLQLLPYTSLSAGAAFLSRRSSTLAQEQPALFVSPYVGLSVQVNVPDIIMAVKGRKWNSMGAQ